MEKSLWLDQYPTRNGIAIPAYELDLPETKLDINHHYEVSNHHDCWYAKKFGNQILYMTLRKLEICQSILPNDVHTHIHNTYEQPRLPRPCQAYNYIIKAAEDGVLLKNGSANKPHYEIISQNLINKVHINYKKLTTM